MDKGKATAKEIRVRRKAELSRAYNRAMANSDISHDCVAHHLGISASLSKRWSDSRDDAVPSGADITLMPEPVRGVLSQWVTDQCSDPGPGGNSNPHEKLARLVEAHGQAMSSTLEALEDGIITRQEAEEIMPTLLRLRDVAQGMYDSMRKRAETDAQVIGLHKATPGKPAEEAG